MLSLCLQYGTHLQFCGKQTLPSPIVLLLCCCCCCCCFAAAAAALLLLLLLLLLQGTVVAIKRLLTNDAVTIERFVSEVRMLARLRHPNLILFMGYCTMPELCIVSEYMSKGSLYSVLHSPEQRKQRAAAATKQQQRQQHPHDDENAEQDTAAESSSNRNAAAAAAVALAAAPSQEFLALELAGTPLEQKQRQLEALEPKLQRLVAVAVARGMAYLHTRTPPILHLVRSRQSGMQQVCSKTVMHCGDQLGLQQ
jgi:serine/threonine protein kinase